MSEPQVLTALPVDVCTACIGGAGGECHTPGCMFWTCPAPTPEQAQRFQQQAITGRIGNSRTMAERQRDGARARADCLEQQAEDFYRRLCEVLDPDEDELEPQEVVDLVTDRITEAENRGYERGADEAYDHLSHEGFDVWSDDVTPMPRRVEGKAE